MSEQYFTITIHSERKRPRRRARRVRVNVWTVVKYAALTLAGIILFRAGAAYGLKERGYSAVGGEAFALLLPVFWYTMEKTVRGYIEDAKTGYKPKI